jgi:hypothetical protein
MEKATKEKLAEIAHQNWSHWMRYLFKKCGLDEKGNVIIPKELAEKWRRQVDTDFVNLSADEQKSDYEVAEYILKKLESKEENETITRRTI